MDDDDGESSRRYAAPELGGIDIVGIRPDVSENGLCTKSADGATRGHKCERREEDFDTSLNTARARRQDKRIRSESNSDTVTDAAGFADFCFQLGAFAPRDK